MPISFFDTVFIELRVGLLLVFWSTLNGTNAFLSHYISYIDVYYFITGFSESSYLHSLVLIRSYLPNSVYQKLYTRFCFSDLIYLIQLIRSSLLVKVPYSMLYAIVFILNVINIYLYHVILIYSIYAIRSTVCIYSASHFGSYLTLLLLLGFQRHVM